MMRRFFTYIEINMSAVHPLDINELEQNGFFEELATLRQEIEEKLGPQDLEHLQKIERWGRAATALGLLTAGLGPNLISAIALGLGRSNRWIIMHHVGHRGYDKVPNIPERYTSKVFARGWRRWIDWIDWQLPEAWIYEHNVLHHSHTGEARDPDLLERNTRSVRQSSLPRPVKYGIISLLALAWRPVYYAPNTFCAWLRRHEPPCEESITPCPEEQKGLWTRCLLPYATIQFGVMPLVYLAFGPAAALSALCNSLLAEVVCNLHTFMVITPNHSGDDLYRFSTPPATKNERLLRQIIGSANYTTGKDFNDFIHLWLNYQIEHHIWPDLPMLRYQELQPKVKALCEKHNIVYTQESVFARFKKMMEISVGKTSMKAI
jgi:fatty acid desaturase